MQLWLSFAENQGRSKFDFTNADQPNDKDITAKNDG
jgi:hypothetical protein